MTLEFSRRGFTLVELIVVVAILGVLAVILIVVIEPLKRISMARDAGRISNIKQISQALESYAAKNGHYPVTTQDADDVSIGCWGNWTAGTTLISDPSHRFLQALIDDGDAKTIPLEKYPISGTTPWAGWWSCSYRYVVTNIGSPDCRYAVIFTDLENVESRPGGPGSDYRPACVSAVNWGEGRPNASDFVIYLKE
jgi:prepilin-type N-terminal cleavage/methylation domain-containing protein